VLLSKTLQSSTLRLAFTYVAVFSSAIFAVLGYVYWSTTDYLDQKTDRDLMAENATLIDSYRNAGRDGVVTLINRRISDEFFNEWTYLLTDLTFSYEGGNLKSWPAVLSGNQGRGEFTPRDWPKTPTPLRLRAIYEVLPNGDHLLVARKADDLGKFRARIAISLGSAAGLFLLLAAAAGISTARRSVARIEAINATSREIIETGLHERISLRGTRDEWDGLAENLNSMLDRIEELIETNRQVSDNIAHDLRTPLTRIRSRLERAYARELDPGQYRALVGDAITELDGVLQTFSSLLRIAEIEAQHRTAQFRRLDLAEIAREVVELLDPTAEDSNATLKLDGDDDVHVVGDRDLLFDAVSNMVDNAIKYGGPKALVKVMVLRGAGGAVLSVADRGPGIPIEERRHVLRRFYRLEVSRRTSGSGLGLSLVSAVANLHGARIEMADNTPGLRIELHFPHAARHEPAPQPRL
jgi:signal transduction histidine kinase